MTRITRTTQALLAATAFIVTPAAALAQNSVAKQADVVADKAQDLQAATNTLNAKVDADQRAQAAMAADANDRDDDGDRDGDRDGRRHHDRDGDDDGGKWGWLGLLGLAGLLGLRRNGDHAHHDRHDHADHARDTARTTTTGTTRAGGLDNDTTTRL